MTPFQRWVLHCVTILGPVSARNLALTYRLRLTSVQSTLSRLVSLGEIQALPMQRDRRKRLYTIKGRN
jgi:CobQ-like glutamine amidotransferase family enzyme